VLPPLFEPFDGGLGWTPTGAWTLDPPGGHAGAGWFASSTIRGQSSTLTYGAPLDLRATMVPQLSVWIKASLSGADIVAVDVSLDGQTWMVLDQQTALAQDWTLRTLDLAAYRGAVIWLRFRLDTMAPLPESASTLGVWIDDLVVQDIPPAPTATAIPTETPPPTATPTEAPILTATPSPPPTPIPAEVTATPTLMP
jgi:hypothetical protein